jgi:type IX secretion system PorP/SprF family membrane protein
MKNSVIFLLFLLGIAFNSFSQHNNQYSQYMFNGLVINPAYAGSNNVLNLSLLHRDQWVGMNGAPKTTSFSSHSSLRNKRINLGLYYVSDTYGVTRKNIVNAIYAYRIFFNKSSLSFGLQMGLDITSNHWEDIETITSEDVVFTGQYDKITTPLAGFGAYYKADNYFAGISFPSLIQIGEFGKTIYRPKLINAGYFYEYSEDLKFKPSILIKYLNHSPLEIDINIDAYYKNFGLGCSYRTRDAIVFMLYFAINDQFSIGYSYDQTISKFKTYNKGSHELMLKYEFGYKVNVQSPRYF